MIAKIIHSGSFRNTINYIVKKEGSEFISTNCFVPGIQNEDEYNLKKEAIVKELTSQFIQGSAESKISKPCSHISLNFAIEDRHLTNEELKEISDKYLNKLGYYTNTNDYVVIRHNDQTHQHVHIVSSKFNQLTKKNVSTSFEKYKSKSITNELEQQYKLIESGDIKKKTITKTKVLRDWEVKNNDELKLYKIDKIVREAKKNSRSLEELQFNLNDKNVDILVRVDDKNQMIGYTFQLDGFKVRSKHLGKGINFKDLKKMKYFSVDNFKLQNEELNKGEKEIIENLSKKLRPAKLGYSFSSDNVKEHISEEEFTFWQTFRKEEFKLDRKSLDTISNKKETVTKHLSREKLISREDAYKLDSLYLNELQVNEIGNMTNKEAISNQIGKYELFQEYNLKSYLNYKFKDYSDNLKSDRYNKQAKSILIDYIAQYYPDDEKQQKELVQKVRSGHRLSRNNLQEIEKSIKFGESPIGIITAVRDKAKSNIESEDLKMALENVYEIYEKAGNKKSFFSALSTSLANNTEVGAIASEVEKNYLERENNNRERYNKSKDYNKLLLLATVMFMEEDRKYEEDPEQYKEEFDPGLTLRTKI